jgi:hypothetical protein
MKPTDDQVIEWALKAGLTGLNVRQIVALKQFAGMASDAGMEYAAKVCEGKVANSWVYSVQYPPSADDCAEAIREEITK